MFVKLFVLRYGWQSDKKSLMTEERRPYNTTIRVDLAKKLRILAAQVEKRQNDLLEEAIQDLVRKYEKEGLKE